MFLRKLLIVISCVVLALTWAVEGMPRSLIEDKIISDSSANTLGKDEKTSGGTSETASIDCPSHIATTTSDSICKKILNTCYCIIAERTNSQEEAGAICRQNSMNVLSIETKEEDEALNQFLKTEGTLPESLEYEDFVGFWTTGSNKTGQSGEFYWDGDVGKKVQYFNWCSGEPNNWEDNDEHAIVKQHPDKKPSGCWNDMPSPMLGSYIFNHVIFVACESNVPLPTQPRSSPPTTSISETTSIDCPSDVGSESMCKRILGTCYCFIGERTNSQLEASAICKRSNMNMLSIETKEEDEALNQLLLTEAKLDREELLSPHLVGLWTTGSNKAENGEFYWNGDEKKVEYFNWCSGEPNNWENNDEHAIVKQHPEKKTGGCWNDMPSPMLGSYPNNHIIYVACESNGPLPIKAQPEKSSIICPSDIGSNSTCERILDTCYCFIGKRTNSQDEAAAVCRRSNMNALSIETKEEDELLNQLLKTKVTLPEEDVWSSHFVGLWTAGSNKTGNGEFYWNGDDDQKVQYFNWCSGEPNNWENNDEHAIVKQHPQKKTGGCWNDMPSPMLGSYPSNHIIYIACESNGPLPIIKALPEISPSTTEATSTESPEKNIPNIAFEFQGLDFDAVERAFGRIYRGGSSASPDGKHTVTLSWSGFKVLLNGLDITPKN